MCRAISTSHSATWRFVACADRGRREEDPWRHSHPLGLRRDRQCGRTERADRDRHAALLRDPWAPISTATTTRPAISVRPSARRTTSWATRRWSPQSGGIGMAIIGFLASAKMGVSAISVGWATSPTSMKTICSPLRAGREHQHHRPASRGFEGRPFFAEVAKRVSKKKPIVVLKASAAPARRARAASSHTGRLAGNDKIYEDVFKQSGVIRARSLRDCSNFARGTRSADAEGQQRGHHHRRGRLGRAALGCPAWTTACR